MNRRLALGAALACALLVPPAASAGTPFTIGTGTSPHHFTDAATGTAHIVWITEPSGPVTYCRLPRGASACEVTRSLTPPAAGIDDPFILRTIANGLRIVMPIYATNDTYEWTSGDNGTTWADGGTADKIYDDVTAGDGGQGTDASEPFTYPGNPSRTTLASSGRRVWQSNGTAEAATDGGALLPGSGGTDFSVAPIDGGTRTLAVGHDSGAAQFWHTGAGANPSMVGNWTGPASLGGIELDDLSLAGGSSGTFLLANAGDVSTQRQELRRFDAGTNTFAAPILLASEIGYMNDVTVGPSGSVAAVWRRNEPSNGNRLQLALSPNGAPGTFAVTTAAREDSVMSDLDVSLAGDSGGWATWEAFGSGANSQIRVADLTTVPEPPTPPAGGGTPSTPATPKATPLPLPAKPKAPTTKSVKVSSNGADITLGVPNGCIPSGRPFVATLSWKKQKRKGNRFVKVSRTDFYIGKARLKIDRKAPFRQTLRIPKPKKGQTYTLKARAFIKMSKGKRVPKKSISTTLRVCS